MFVKSGRIWYSNQKLKYHGLDPICPSPVSISTSFAVPRIQGTPTHEGENLIPKAVLISVVDTKSLHKKTMASLHLLSPVSKFCSSLFPLSHHYTHHLPSLSFIRFTSTTIKSLPSKSLATCFALTDSESPKSIEPELQSLLQEIAVRFYCLIVPTPFGTKIELFASGLVYFMPLFCTAGQFWSSSWLLCSTPKRSPIGCKWNMYCSYCLFIVLIFLERERERETLVETWKQ